MEPCPNHYRSLSEYPVSGNDREQRGKEDINQGPFLVSGRTSGQWTIKTEILKRSIYEVERVSVGTDFERFILVPKS